LEAPKKKPFQFFLILLLTTTLPTQPLPRKSDAVPVEGSAHQCSCSLNVFSYLVLPVP